MGTDLIPRASLDELLAARDKALSLYAEAHALHQRMRDTLKEAHMATRRACGGREVYMRDMTEKIDTEAEKFTKLAREEVDRRMWVALLEITGIGGMMDKQAHAEFERELASAPPEVTFDNVRATFMEMRDNRKAIFRRGLVNVFSNLCREYRSHDGFKIGHRIILTYALSESGYLSERHALADADRIMHVLDGQSPEEGWRSGLAGLLDSSCDRGRWTNNGYEITPGEIETEYWRAKWFKNRNMHLHPKRPDLVRRANRLIAEHFGETLGAGPDAAHARKYHRAKPHHSEVEDFYPTSPTVVEQMLALADLRPGLEVLEPSAGDGAIVRGLLMEGIKPDCFEIDRDRADILEDMLPPGAVACMDFLKAVPEPVYDRVLMNPPFGKGAGVQHVLHAMRFLKPGGILVAVLGAGLRHNTDGPSRELRGLLSAWRGIIRNLPAGSFKHAGTYVDTVLLAVTAPAGTMLAAPEPRLSLPA